MENFKQKFIDIAYTKFGIGANESINFEQAFAIIDEIEQRNIANVVGQSGQLPCELCSGSGFIHDDYIGTGICSYCNE